ncbi:hypothetical protein [Candidatus Colwellia aromaticivorans]|uniref:hypothetical protein n=1 Tax=Candidatus Colwellia aromaticivorans TaxID=2267621 RepID=UPI000DF3E6C8|nr:hypothetical protein [Candidatus Colwellia aromaticivorans]
MTVNDIQQQLKLINIKSQQLLKRLEYNIDTDENLEVDEITQLQTAREQLISHLFSQYSRDDIEKELLLINQMVNLDADLQMKTEELKQAFASKLIKIQKGKKSAITYNKY